MQEVTAVVLIRQHCGIRSADGIYLWPELGRDLARVLRREMFEETGLMEPIEAMEALEVLLYFTTIGLTDNPKAWFMAC